jgi:hypothetical protein
MSSRLDKVVLVALYEGLSAGLVDPGGVGERGCLGPSVPEPTWICVVGGVQSGLTLPVDLAGVAEVDRGRGVQRDATVAVLVVVVMQVIASRGWLKTPRDQVA